MTASQLRVLKRPDAKFDCIMDISTLQKRSITRWGNVDSELSYSDRNLLNRFYRRALSCEGSHAPRSSEPFRAFFWGKFGSSAPTPASLSTIACAFLKAAHALSKSPAHRLQKASRICRRRPWTRYPLLLSLPSLPSQPPFSSQTPPRSPQENQSS